MKKAVLPLLLFTVLAATTPSDVSAAPKPTPTPTPTATPSVALDATGWTTPKPPYPDAARKAKLSGSVQVRVFTDRHGKIKKAIVKQSSGHPELDDATVQFALANWSGPAFSQAVFMQNYTYKK